MTDSFTGKCRDLSAKGLGVFHHPDGRVVFVPGTWPEDVGEVRMERWEKRYGFGRLIALHQPSPDRQEPSCQHQGYDSSRCGGCPWMIGSYPAQLRYKQQFVRHFIQRAGLDSEIGTIKPIVPSPALLSYRNRAQFKSDGDRLGFVAQGTNEITDIESCLILNAKNQKTLAALRARLPEPSWRPQKGRPWVSIDIDDTIDPGAVQLNRRLPFRQGNDAQNEYMKRWLRDKLSGLPKDAEVLELFSGSGNFTEVIAGAGFAKITASDAGKAAIAALDARRLSGVQSYNCDLFKPNALNFLRKHADPRYLVMDPPRAGFQMLSRYCEVFLELQEIFYVTCDLASFSSDIKKICRSGWVLREVQPLDQFPHTPHVEALAHLVKDNS